jgi:hypothetical protein
MKYQPGSDGQETSQNMLQAPTGKFRVIVIDKFQDNEHGIFGDYDSLEEALAVAALEGFEDGFLSSSPRMAASYSVYDENGRCVGGESCKRETF